MDSANDSCPVCKSDRFLNPNLRLLVSLCYHKMCESCINRLFQAGTAPCPVCKTLLRRMNFDAQTFEDLRVQKEVNFRKKVGKFFNKRLEDFNGNERAYNDYLEEVEDIMFNLVNDVDVQATTERIERFRQENRELIEANVKKQLNEDKAVGYRLKREREEKVLRREALLLHEQEEERNKEIEKKAMIDELATSDKSPEEIIQAYKKRIASQKQSSHSTATLEHILQEAAQLQEQDLYGEDADSSGLYNQGGMSSSDFDAFEGMRMDPIPGIVMAASGGYMDPWTMEVGADLGARASGYMPQWSHVRAIQSAFYGLLVGTETG